MDAEAQLVPETPDSDTELVPLWERKEEESPKSYEMFTTFRDLGPTRTISAACKRYYGPENSNSKLRGMTELSRLWSWFVRAEAYDAYLERQGRVAKVEEVKEMNKRHIGIARAGLSKAVQALAKLKVDEMKPSDIAKLIELSTKLERLALGENTESIKQEIKGETKTILEVVELIVPVRGEMPKPESVSAAVPQLTHHADIVETVIDAEFDAKMDLPQEEPRDPK